MRMSDTTKNVMERQGISPRYAGARGADMCGEFFSDLLE